MKNLKAKKLVGLISLMLCLCVFAGVMSACQPDVPNVYNTTSPTETAATTEGTTSDSTEEVLPENPIDFKELQNINKDLYAWLKIPGTVIDYPVAQSSNEDDNYYLHRDYRGNYDFAGTIYSQRHNTKYFVERVTVLYGHNMLDGSMFAGLHQFSNPDFLRKTILCISIFPGIS